MHEIILCDHSDEMSFLLLLQDATLSASQHFYKMKLEICQILTFLTFGSHERVKVKVVFFYRFKHLCFVLCTAVYDQLSSHALDTSDHNKKHFCNHHNA